jgi:hypothetical protein
MTERQKRNDSIETNEMHSHCKHTPYKSCVRYKRFLIIAPSLVFSGKKVRTLADRSKATSQEVDEDRVARSSRGLSTHSDALTSELANKLHNERLLDYRILSARTAS